MRYAAVVAAFTLALTRVADVRAAVPSLGTVRIFVILASFADRNLAHPPEAFVGPPGALATRLVGYYDAVSAGRLRIAPHLGAPAVTLTDRRARYVQHPEAIARQAIDAFAAVAPPAEREALRAAQGVVVFFAGPGRESHVSGGDPDDPWSNYTQFGPPSEGFGEALVIAEEEVAPFSSFGVLCHEFGHLLGLPELYAPGDAQHEGIGVWGLMGQGTWLAKGERPPALEAWSKVRLGWVDVEDVDRTAAAVALPAVADAPHVLRIPAVPGRPEEYYLLENRVATGVDALLPGSGLLVWHVDERVRGLRDAQRDRAHQMLHLVEADGRGDLDRGHRGGGNRGDATDPWAGPPTWQVRTGQVLVAAGACVLAFAVLRLARARPLLGATLRALAGVLLIGAGRALSRAPTCGPGTPGMSPYDGEPVRVVLRRISPAGPVMTLDVLVAPDLRRP